MDTDTFRDGGGNGGPPAATYWRRRFLALVGGLTILALIAWAFSGAFAVNRASGLDRSAAGTHSGHPHGGPSGGGGGGQVPQSAGTGSEGAAKPGQGASPSASPSPPGRRDRRGTPKPAKSPTPSPSASRPAHRQHGGEGPLRHCGAGAVVLSISAGQAVYGGGQLPVFEVAVVSTARAGCTFNVGPRFLSLVIRSRGRRVFDSADCTGRPGSLVVDLARGVPAMVPVSWARQLSAPGCAGRARHAAAGRYTVQAYDKGVRSTRLSFRIA